MGYVESVDDKVRGETRAVLCRGYRVTPSNRKVADAVHAWALEHGGKLGDMSLQFIAHGEDLASDWDERPFLVGIFVREVFGLGGDHELGLTEQDLAQSLAAADARLDALAPSLDALLATVKARRGDRALYLTCSGPLCTARLVKGQARASATDDEYYWSVEEGEPGYFFARQGSTQDEAPHGAFGFELALSIYDNFDDPIEVTTALLGAADAGLAKIGLRDPRLFVFPQYD